MAKKTVLGTLQLAIMQILWKAGEASVAEVHEQLLPARSLALTTVATMLRKMEHKGVVAHRQEGRSYIYHPLVAESEVRRSMVGLLVERLFHGDPAQLVSHLLSEADIDPDELEALKRQIERQRRDDA